MVAVRNSEMGTKLMLLKYGGVSIMHVVILLSHKLIVGSFKDALSIV